MRSIVVYYSLEGNCEYIAKLITERYGTELLKLKPINDIKPTRYTKYFWGGLKAIFKTKPKLVPYEIDFSKYDIIFIGTPVWAGTHAPAINTFMKQTNLDFKKIILYCTHGGRPGTTIERLVEKYQDSTILGEEEFFEPLKQNQKEEIYSKVNDFLVY